MPELPEVETIACDLRSANLIGEKITNCYVSFPKAITGSLKEFIAAIHGQTLKSIERRGKYLVFELSNGKFIAIHLRMTGKFTIKPRGIAFTKHEHVALEFNHQRLLIYHDTRKFGRWTLFDQKELFFKKLGPEPLSPSFTLQDFTQRIKKTKRQLKPLLLDQTFIAGLGNIYVDEALWESQLHPENLSSSLTLKTITKLYQAIKKVLLRGLETQGTTLGSGKTNYYRLDGSKGKHQDSLNVFRKTNHPCPRCQTPIIRIKVAQRSTHLCPSCQKS